MTWQQFTLDNWKDPFGDQSLTDAFVVSLKVAAISTVIATVLGSLIAIALARYKFRGSGGLNFLLVLPLTTPEIVLGSSLATLFLDWDITSGIHHGRDRPHHVPGQFRRADGARPCTRLRLDARTGRAGSRRVAAPNILEGDVPARSFRESSLRPCLSFALSLDDFIITLFNAGSLVTFPLYINGAFRVKFPPEVNVLATAILVVSVALMLTGTLWGTRGRRRSAT